jgi:alpha-L-fucosidase
MSTKDLAMTSRRGFLATTGMAGLALACGTAGQAAAATTAPLYDATLTSLARHPLPTWWRDGKFGVFVHWGVYSVPAWAPTDWPLSSTAEWYWLLQQLPLTPYWQHHLETYGPGLSYDDLIPRFGAEHYDPESWADLFVAAGARYFVLTSKHHEGFALFPSAVSDRNAAVLGPRRDLVGPLVIAARQRGLKTGLYYSVPEWFNPAPHLGATLGRLQDIGRSLGMGTTPADLLGPIENLLAFNELPPRNAYTQRPVAYTGYRAVDDYGAFERAQLREIIARYHPDQIWADIGGPEDYFQGNRIIAEYYNQAAFHNPGGVVVNDRFGDLNTHRDYSVVENGGTYQSGTLSGAPSETVRTMGNSWGYNTNDTLAPAETFIRELVVAVANNSNYVLNIGPRADGTIPQPMADRLRTIGAWLGINGEGIYATRPWTQPDATSSAGAVYFTTRPDTTLYLTTLSWPGRELRVTAPLPLSTGTRMVLLGSDGKPLPWSRNADGVTITMPADGDEHAATSSQYAFTIRITD